MFFKGKRRKKKRIRKGERFNRITLVATVVFILGGIRCFVIFDEHKLTFHFKKCIHSIIIYSIIEVWH